MSKQSTTIISNIRKNGMGTSSFDMKMPNMRKPQDFIVYPMSKNSDWTEIHIQSENRFGKLNLLTGKGIMSTPKGYANSLHLMVCEIRKQATEFEVSAEDLATLKAAIKTTAGDKVGSYGIVSDNSAAAMTTL